MGTAAKNTQCITPETLLHKQMSRPFPHKLSLTCPPLPALHAELRCLTTGITKTPGNVYLRLRLDRNWLRAGEKKRECCWGIRLWGKNDKIAAFSHNAQQKGREEGWRLCSTTGGKAPGRNVTSTPLVRSSLCRAISSPANTGTAPVVTTSMHFVAVKAEGNHLWENILPMA